MTESDIDILFDEATIADRVQILAKEIAASGLENPLLIPVLTGSFVFAADLMRALHRAGLAVEVDFLRLASYGAGTESKGSVKVLCDIDQDVTGRDVLLVDDILDTGLTLAFARDLLLKRGARHVSLAVLLDKSERRTVKISADFVGFACPDRFVVGYGIDKGYAYRELPYVGAF
ncbi:MAG: hypoxanthine phosphoribosyltransferase [Hyphomicrobiales bacterium]|mgnify:CR=1 FL=1|nr:MAG: hypoxanthine phosphoribosyltransferase [Hyphomicrobiales bacterium]